MLFRSDLAELFGGQFDHCGFSIDVMNLEPGAYHLVLYAHSSLDASFNAKSVDITVLAPQPDPWMSVEGPPSDSIQPNTFTVSGWALDRGADTGSGVDGVHVWAFPADPAASARFLGVATSGISRPDVGGVFGAQFTNSGFRLAAGPLPPGRYTITVFVHSSVTGTFNQERSLPIVVR